MADTLYTAGKKAIIDHGTGTIDWVNDTIKVMLIGTAAGTYTPSAAHVYASEINTYELTGVSGYTRGYGQAGRKALGSKTITISGTDVKLDAGDCVAGAVSGWTALGAGDTIVYAVLVKEVTSDAASPIIAAFALTSTPTNGSDIGITWSSSGLITI